MIDSTPDEHPIVQKRVAKPRRHRTLPCDFSPRIFRLNTPKAKLMMHRSWDCESGLSLNVWVGMQSSLILGLCVGGPDIFNGRVPGRGPWLHLCDTSWTPLGVGLPNEVILFLERAICTPPSTFPTRADGRARKVGLSSSRRMGPTPFSAFVETEWPAAAATAGMKIRNAHFSSGIANQKNKTLARFCHCETVLCVFPAATYMDASRPKFLSSPRQTFFVCRCRRQFHIIRLKSERRRGKKKDLAAPPWS
jgi:hypothetical protein